MVYQRGTYNTKMGAYLEGNLDYLDDCGGTRVAGGMENGERGRIVAVKGKGVMRGDAKRRPYLYEGQ